MGSNIVYFPVYFEKEYQRNFAYPFILRANGTTVTLRPDTTRRQTLTLTRKYPLHHNKVYHGNALVGARFQASNDPTFQNPVTIHRVTHNPNMQPVIVPVDTTQKYRYWRFNHTKIVELAEWRFKDNRGLNLTGKSMDPEGREPASPTSSTLTRFPMEEYPTGSSWTSVTPSACRKSSTCPVMMRTACIPETSTNYFTSTSVVGNLSVVKSLRVIPLILKTFPRTPSTGCVITRQVKKSACSRYKTENNVSGKIKSSFLFVLPFFFQEK